MLETIFANPIVAFMILVGAVVLFHELGHYLAGRALGVEVEEFSIGFGPRAFGFKRGNTDYRISWLPLGGYVRFYGAEIGQEIPLEKREKSILTAKLYKRAIISAAGPGANFILSLIIMIVLAFVGMPQAPSLIAVMPGSVAEMAGLETGDKILRINEKEVRTWEDLNKYIATAGGQKLSIQVEREGAGVVQVDVTPAVNETENAMGEKVKVGRIGVTAAMLSPRIMVSENSLLSAMGVQSGDVVTKINDRDIRYFHEISKELSKAVASANEADLKKQFRDAANPQDFSRKITLVLKRPEQPFADNKNLNAVEKTLNISLDSTQEWFLKWVAQAESASADDSQIKGFEKNYASTDLSFFALEELKRGDKRLPARAGWEACGLVRGDSFWALSGFGRLQSPVQLGMWLEKWQNANAGRALKAGDTEKMRITVLNPQGRLEEKACEIPLRDGRDSLNRQQAFLDFPLTFVTQGVPIKQVTVKSESIAAAFEDGTRAAWGQVNAIFAGLKKLVTGSVPLSNLGGPIAIARVAGSAAEGGVLIFLLTMSWMSINIGMFNLLPLPALDGGTLLLHGVEAAYGKYLPPKLQENVQRLGIAIMLLLIVLVFYNDILRLFHS